MSDRPGVWIYRRMLLRESETFIDRQAAALSRYVPTFVGARRTPGFDLPAERTVVAGGPGRRGRAAELLFTASGRSARLAGAARRARPALVHAHFGPDGLEILPLARRARLPLVVTFHGYDASVNDDALRARGYTDRRFAAHRDELARSGALFLAVSEFVRQRLIDRGFPPERVVVHHIGVDVDSQPGPSAADPAARHVVFVGRLAPKKGVLHLVEAIAECQRTAPDTRLTVVGDGPLRAQAEALAGDRLRNHRFVGWREPREVSELLRSATVICVPSVTAPDGDTEGLPTVVVEAGALGVPTVGFRHAGIPEFVEHDATGLLADEGDAATLGTLLARAVGDAELRERLGAAARERARADFDIRRQTALLEEIYDREAAAGR
jgi:glycosyltransferase involved in cell wall biosynthesis